MKPERGFTLIELMIVVAIIGILASIALPAYKNYIARAQASEGFALLSGAKTPLAEYYADKGQWPSHPTALGLTAGGKYVLSDMEFTSGANSTSERLELTATFRSSNISQAISGRKLVLATSTAGTIWICRRENSADGIDNQYLPAACR